jgi:recombination protein RecR
LNAFPAPLRRCLDELQKLPGVGPKSAQRILFALLDRGPEPAHALAQALEDLVGAVERCPTCRAYREKGQPCCLCDDPRRDGTILCVVETAADVLLIEATGEYTGLYHVLHGLLSPLKGIHPEHLGLEALETRLEKSQLREVILATPPTAEGEATASYLATLVGGRGARVSRIAFGMPVGADFQFVDAQTLGRSLSGRRNFA